MIEGKLDAHFASVLIICQNISQYGEFFFCFTVSQNYEYAFHDVFPKQRSVLRIIDSWKRTIDRNEFSFRVCFHATVQSTAPAPTRRSNPGKKFQGAEYLCTYRRSGC